MKKLTIGHLYPDLLNLYLDRLNIQCFRKRLEWRGMEAEVIPFLSGEKIDFSNVKVEPLFEEEGDFDMNLLHLKKKIDRMLKENLK